MSCPRDFTEMKELKGQDESTLWVSETEGGVWADSVDVNRLLLHSGLPGLESMGGRANLDAIGEQCPKDEIDLIVIEGNEHLAYGYCEVCNGLWLELDLDQDPTVKEIETAMVAFFRRFRKAGASRSVRP